MIYFATNSDDSLLKIGTTRRLKDRMRCLAREVGPITLVGVMAGGMAEEAMLHKAFDDYHVKGEWFLPDKQILRFIDKWASQFAAHTTGETFPLCFFTSSIARQPVDGGPVK